MKVTARNLFGISLLVGALIFGFELLRSLTDNESFMPQLAPNLPTTNYRTPSAVKRRETQNVTDKTRMTAQDGARLVLILSYQRCGSSFFGGLFDMAPEGFYVYEPLDSLYDAMYGTPEGWNVPSDIMNHSNGTIRVIPEFELREVSDFLANLLQCKLQSLPLEFFLHKFWNQFAMYETSLRPFMECLKKQNIQKAHGRCYEAIRSRCPGRFGVGTTQRNGCREYFLQRRASRAIQRQGRAPPDPFGNYSSCLDRYRSKVEPCVSKMRDLCERSLVRSAKTVRATMASVEYLMERIPNLKVVHLIRDPRPVVLSRKNFDASGQSLFSKGDLIKEAKLFCQNVAEDIAKRRELEEKYPGSTIEVLYDRFVEDPLKYSEDIYRFLGVGLTKSVRKWIVKNTKKSQNSTAIAQKWQRELSYMAAKQIAQNCRNVFDLNDRIWSR